jgi:hypothetical protein
MLYLDRHWTTRDTRSWEERVTSYNILLMITMICRLQIFALPLYKSSALESSLMVFGPKYVFIQTHILHFCGYLG